jgi:hypothetical protein
MEPLMTKTRHPLSRTLVAALLATTLLTARAHPPNASDASALSALPIVMSVAAPVMLLSAGAVLTVVAVEASATGTVWVLERASDGARMSLTVSAQAAGGLSVAAGTAVVVSAFSAGWVISTAGRAIAYIPNEIGTALLYNERVTR